MTDNPSSCSVCSASVNLGLLLVRLPFGLFFLLAGVSKIRGGISNFVEHAGKMTPAWLPQLLGSAYLHALPFAEILTGLMVMLGLLTRVAGVLQTLMLISIIIALGGVKPVPNTGPFHFNAIYLGIALMLALVGPGAWSIDQALFGRKGTTE
jgi:uncharacterized membrane protein YphA (DoxX/SURF4 family)